jgi:hypothetical protein
LAFSSGHGSGVDAMPEPSDLGVRMLSGNDCTA